MVYVLLKAKFLLIPGNEYAFTIRAVDREGRDLFKNDGYSEVYKFTWGDECKPPAGIQAEAVSGGGIDLKWKTAPAHTGYNVQYRTKGHGSWYTQNSFIDNTSIYELPGNTEIEYQLQSVCGGYQSDYSEIYAIKTKEEEKRNFSCGDGKDVNSITNTTPKTILNIDDKFTAGGFTAMITKISGHDGTFTGECNVLVPFFNFARVPHQFNNIKINELNQMYEGKLVSIYNPNSRFVAHVGGGKNKAEDSTEIASTKKDSTGIEKIVANANGDSTKTAHLNSANQLVIVNAAGDSIVLTKQGVEPSKELNVGTVNSNNFAADSAAMAHQISDSTTTVNDSFNEKADATDVSEIENTIGSGVVGSENGSTTPYVSAKFTVQQDVFQIGYGKLTPVVFSIFHDLKDTTNARVEFVVDNPQAKQLYSFPFLEDKKLDGTPSNTVGDKFYHSTWIPGLNQETFPQPGKHTLTFNLVKDKQQLAQKALQIEVLPKYELTGLTATDANHTKRMAKAGETLYLVKSPKSNASHKVIYKLSTTGGNNSFWPDEPNWRTVFSDKTVEHLKHTSSLTIVHDDFPSITIGKITNTTNVSAFGGQTLSVNIELLKENIQSINANPTEIALLPIKTTILQKATDAVQTYFPFLKLKLTTKDTYITYNKEDEATRYYKKFRQISHQTILELTKKDPIIIWGTDIKKVMSIGVYVLPSVYGYHKISVDYEKLFFENNYKQLGIRNNFGAGIKLELGGRIAIAQDSKDIKCEARVYGSSGIRFDYEYIAYTNKQVIQVIFDPLVVGISAKVSIPAWDWELVNYSYEHQIFDRKITTLNDN